jgi:hypothetical protein
MCLNFNARLNLITATKFIIGILSLIQMWLLYLIVNIAIGFHDEEIYNMEDLELKKYRNQAEFIGSIFTLLALCSSFLGIILISHPRICL